MPTPITVTDLLDQCRSQLDESNTVNVTETDLLYALNRGQDYASDLLVRHYPDPLLLKVETPVVAGQQAYDFPEDIFEDRLQKVEVKVGAIYWPMQRINYRQATLYETASQTPIPRYYYIIGKKFYVLPTPGGANAFRFWYIGELETLVRPQGRITSIDTGNNRVVLNELGSDLTTESTNLNNYVNFIDATTGILKGSAQIQSIDTEQNRVTIKAVPTRSSVLNRTISGTLPTDLSLDDYICMSRGNCIPYLKKPLSNYMIQYAVMELKRKMGEPATDEKEALEKFEEQVKHQWAGRENQFRVAKASRNWMTRFRRNFLP